MAWQFGIDKIVHETALEEGGKTIAVLGNGFNHIYPISNEGLYNRIINNGGLVISEYNPEEIATSEKFLQRNRIVSGISLGVLVIESAYRSGTSVTARLAKEQGRNVFAIPHDINNSHGVGNNRLIKSDVAKLVRSTEDIIKEFPNIVFKKITKQNQTKEFYKNINYNKNNNEDIITKKTMVMKNEGYNEIYRLIGQGRSNIGEIYKKSNKGIGEINNILLMLEIDGYIEKIAGGYRCTTIKKQEK